LCSGAQANSQTFDFQAGDVGYVPKSMPHFVENTRNITLRFLELFHSPRYMSVSLTQWMADTPHELVQAQLDIDRQPIDALPKEKRPVVSRERPPSFALSEAACGCGWQFGRILVLRMEANMPHVGPVPEGSTFFCPNCGALYSVTHSGLAKTTKTGDIR
jgi:hypothetical protein